MSEKTEVPREKISTLEELYAKYLSDVKLSEDNMSEEQRIETKRAFYGACGLLLYVFRDEMGAMTDELKAVEAMEDLWVQVATFWNEQNKLAMAAGMKIVKDVAKDIN